MFLGEYIHAIDEKGRLTIPAKFRADLAGGLVITRGQDRCLVIHPMDEWNALAQRVSQLPTTDQAARDFQRFIFSSASDAFPDRQGRVVIPQHLREYAGLDGEAVVAGLYTHIEVWNIEAWTQVRENVENEERNAERWAALEI